MIWEADSMTNFECMKQKIVNTVMGSDEIELLNLADDTEMATSGAEGIFNCTVCEEVYGECNSKYLEWYRKEYSAGDRLCLKSRLIRQRCCLYDRNSFQSAYFADDFAYFSSQVPKHHFPPIFWNKYNMVRAIIATM